MAMLPPLRRRRVVIGALGAAVLLAALVGWRVWQVRADLLQSRDYAEALRGAADERDLTDARVALDALRDHAGDAADGTSGPSWWLLEHLPAVGDDARAVATMAQALSGLADAADPLLGIAEDVDRGRVSIVGGRIPLDILRGYEEPMTRAAATASRARVAVEGLDGDYVAPLASAVTDARTELDRASTALDEAADVVTTLPGLLGADGPRRYLLVLQSNAGIRSTGGYPGSGALVKVDAGRIRLGRAITAHSVDPLGAGALGPATRAVFGTGTARKFYQANRIPDVATVADLWAEHYRTSTGIRVDGVLTADTVALSYLSDVVGGVRVAGRRIPPDRFLGTVLSDVYVDTTGPQQDRILEGIGRALFDRLQEGRDPIGVAEALKRGYGEGRIAWDVQDLTDAGLRSRPILEDGDVGIFLNDTVGEFGSKLGYYLRTRLTLPSGCAEGARRARLSLDLLPAAGDPRLGPAVTGVPAGRPVRERLDVFVVSSVDGRVRVGDRTGREWKERRVVRIPVSLRPGQRRSIDVRWSGADDAAGTLRVTPSVVPGSTSVELPASTC